MTIEPALPPFPGTPPEDERKNGLITRALERLPIIDCGRFGLKLLFYRQLTLQKGRESGWSRHPFFELIYIRHGRMGYRTRERELPRSSGSLLFMPADVEHHWSVASAPCVLEGFMFEFLPMGPGQQRFVDGLASWAREKAHRFLLPKEGPACYRALDAEWLRGDALVERRLGLLAVDLFIHLMRANFPEALAAVEDETLPGAAGRSLEIFRQARQLIENRLGESLKPVALAQALGITPRYLNLVFTRVAGEPVGRYIQERRLRRAYQLLLSEPATLVRVIADRCGFPDQLYFTRAFTRRFKQAPTALRAKAGG